MTTPESTPLEEKWAYAEAWEGEDYVVTVRGATENPVGSCYTRREAQMIAAFLNANKHQMLDKLISSLLSAQRAEIVEKLCNIPTDLIKNADEFRPKEWVVSVKLLSEHQDKAIEEYQSRIKGV